MERHDGAGDHPDHHHHTIDTFFSLLQYVDEVSPPFVLVKTEILSSTAIASALQTWRFEVDHRSGVVHKPDIPWYRCSVSTAHSLRGPPLA
jgi:hypothetical protein